MPIGRSATYPAERIRALALRAWLYRITLNVARNRFRGKKLRTGLARSSDLGRQRRSGGSRPTTPTRPDARVRALRANARDIADAVAALPERYRAPLMLRYVEGLRLEEVATVLRQPLGTTKSNVHRGINALREALSSSRREGVRT